MPVRPASACLRTLYCQSLKIQAVLLLTLGRKSLALDRFQRILQLQPLDLHALASRAHLQTQLGDWDGAIAGLLCQVPGLVSLRVGSGGIVEVEGFAFLG